MTTIFWHRDGHTAETVETGLTDEEARQWLDSKSKEVGQPVLQGAVNESDEFNCGYWYAKNDDDRETMQAGDEHYYRPAGS